MKKIILVMLCITILSLHAQQNSDVVDMKKHYIVMQFSNGDSLSQQTVMGQVKNIRTAWPNAQIEVVCHGTGLNLLVAAKSNSSQLVTDWAGKGVIFGACNNTMKRNKVTKADLLPAAQVVPSAMIELTRRQEEHYAYVKGGH